MCEVWIYMVVVKCPRCGKSEWVTTFAFDEEGMYVGTFKRCKFCGYLKAVPIWEVL